MLLLEKPLGKTALTEQASVRPAVDYPLHGRSTLRLSPVSHPRSPKNPGAKNPSSAQPQDHPQRMPGVPNPREPSDPEYPPQNFGVPSPDCKIRAFLECPTPVPPKSSQHRLSPESARRRASRKTRQCPTPECKASPENPWSAQPGEPNLRVCIPKESICTESLECPTAVFSGNPLSIQHTRTWFRRCCWKCT